MSMKRVLMLKILEYLREKVKVVDKELYEMLSKQFDISYSQFLTTIMQLEIEGFVVVSEGKDYTIMLKKS